MRKCLTKRHRLLQNFLNSSNKAHTGNVNHWFIRVIIANIPSCDVEGRLSLLRHCKTSQKTFKPFKLKKSNGQQVEKQFSEEEIANRIVELRDHYHLSFRKIAQKLSMEGYRISKDKVWRLYKKTKAPKATCVEEPKGLRKLKDRQERTRKHLQFLKERNEIRRDIVSLIVQRVMEDFEERQRLFADPNRMCQFARKTVAVTEPMIWRQFIEHCEEHDYNLVDAMSIAAGKQQDFEEQFKSGGQLSLDVYIACGMKDCLEDWSADKREDNDKQEQQDPERIVTIIETDTANVIGHFSFYEPSQ